MKKKFLYAFIFIFLSVNNFVYGAAADNKLDKQNYVKKMDVSKAKDILDVKGVLDFPSKIRILFIVLGITGVLCFIYLIILFFIRQKAKYDLAHAKKPYEIAYERLDELIKKRYIEKELIKEFYFELSTIIRYYIEDRFNLKAPEMTTEEFLTQVKESQELKYEDKSLLRDFLSHCDIVKFAKYMPTEKEIFATVNLAKKFIEETKFEPENMPGEK